MIVIRDENRIERMAKIGRYTSFFGMALLLGGFALAFMNDVQNLILLQLLALSGGWLVSQAGMYLSHRYVRSPRMDEVLDDTFKKMAKNGRFYHYVLSAPHVLLMPYGLIVVNAKYQGGEILVTEEGKWLQKGVGMKKFFGQEGVGKPAQEVESMVQSTAAFLNKNAPSVEEIPIAPMIVFTTKGVDQLSLKNSTMPAMHYTKVKGFLRNQKQPEPLPKNVYEAVRAAFDQKAGIEADD